MKNYGTNKHPAKNFSNADFISVNCVGLIDFSLLDVPSIKAHITTQEIVDIVREGRER
jgi:hypothetical protein